MLSLLVGLFWWVVLALLALRLYHIVVSPGKEIERTPYEADRPGVDFPRSGANAAQTHSVSG